MSFTPQNPKDALSKLDMLTKGVDAARHGLLGCVIAQNGTSPEQQARNYLYSLRRATEQDIAGRDRNNDLAEDEFRHWLARLEKWERTNTVTFPPRAGSADHPEHRRA